MQKINSVVRSKYNVNYFQRRVQKCYKLITYWTAVRCFITVARRLSFCPSHLIRFVEFCLCRLYVKKPVDVKAALNILYRCI